MFQKVVVPLDGSQLAEKVLPYVRQVTSPLGSEIILLMNIDLTSYAFAANEVAMTGGLYESFSQSGQTYLVRQKATLEEAGYRVRCEITTGDTATRITEFATEVGADLIAMTTHGRTGMSRWALGSVADRIVRSALQPVLLIRADAAEPDPPGVLQILVPLDGSQLAEQALPIAQMLAQKMGARILLLQAVEALDDEELAQLFGQGAIESRTPVTWFTDAEQYLAHVQKKLEFVNVICDVRAVIGTPAEMILDTATAADCDLIVMSTHGRSGLSRWVYGSVASKVLHEAKCPLLLVRGHVRETVAQASEIQGPVPEPIA